MEHKLIRGLEEGSTKPFWRYVKSLRRENSGISPLKQDGKLHNDSKDKGNTNLAVNYRPVSLTCVCCKLLEHIIYSHVMAHLQTNNLLSVNQHGFRSGFSCETQLILTVHDLLGYGLF